MKNVPLARIMVCHIVRRHRMPSGKVDEHKLLEQNLNSQPQLTGYEELMRIIMHQMTTLSTKLPENVNRQ
jgi:hypothetical protein